VATTIIQNAPQRDAGKGVLARIGAGIGAGFAAVMRFLCDLSNARRYALEVERLTALSDAELARLGLRRDQIVQHVFRNNMHE
jgi:uncharacterized protein YjiS (DUF1127 family)